MGALDVCPFIPVSNTTMEECVECAKEFGYRLSQELCLPGKVPKKVSGFCVFFRLSFFLPTGKYMIHQTNK